MYNTLCMPAEFDDPRFHDRVLPQLDRITAGRIPEAQKLKLIGRIVDGVMNDLQPTYEEHPLRQSKPQPARPSVLPKHDDYTIGRLGQHSRELQRRGIPPAQRAWVMQIVEHAELYIQGEDRPAA